MDTDFDLAELRREYRRIRAAACFDYDRSEWEAAVAAEAERLAGGSEPLASHWLDAAATIELPCRRCCGTGVYHWGGTVNGKPVHSGPCYRCEGKGRQGLADWFRNSRYTRYAIVAACR